MPGFLLIRDQVQVLLLSSHRTREGYEFALEYFLVVSSLLYLADVGGSPQVRSVVVSSEEDCFFLLCGENPNMKLC